MSDVSEGAKAKGPGPGKKAGAGGARAAGGAKAEGGAAGAGKEKKPGAANGNAVVMGQISRMLVRSIWAQEWMLAHPEAKGEDRKAAWKDAREAAMESHLKPYRRALNTLARGGVTLGLTAAAIKKGVKADDDDGED